MKRLLAIVAATLVATPALAGEVDAEARTSEDLDRAGLFLQLQTGPAYLNLFDSASSVTGPALGLQVAAGWEPVRNLVVLGEFATHHARSLRASQSLDERAVDGSMSLTYLGPGVAYYFGDSGFYLGGGVGVARVVLDNEWVSESDQGFAVRVGLGKDWWVSDRLALGVAFQFFSAAVELEDGTEALDRAWPRGSNLPSGGGSPEHAAQSYGLTFTATYR